MAEADLYDPVLRKLSEQFSGIGSSSYLETSAKGFTEQIKAAIPPNRDILFKFLNRKPDILGFVAREYRKDFITVEIKEKSLKLDHVYQAKMYKEVFGARYGFLVTAAEIPEELKRLCKATPSILRSIDDGSFRFLAIARFFGGHGFIDWFEENPFENDYFWKP